MLRGRVELCYPAFRVSLIISFPSFHSNGYLDFSFWRHFIYFAFLEKSRVSPGVEQGERQVYTQKLRRANQHTLAKVE